MPTVTVLIPAYNAGAFVEDAITSALRQTWKDLEVIVVDDGSTDDTRRRAAAFGHPVGVVSITHGGLSWARNHGLRAATGQTIVFLDADDILEESLVERAVRCLERRGDLGFVFVNLRDLLPDGRLTPAFIPSNALGESAEGIVRDPLRQVLCAGYRISSSGLCARREILAEAGFFDETLWGAEDFDYWSRLYLRRPVGYIADPLVRLRRHATNMTNQPERMIPCMARALEIVIARCRAEGREDQSPWASAYMRRNMLKALQGVLLQGGSRNARELLWRYRAILAGPTWLALALLSVAPHRLLAAAARLRASLRP